MDEATAHADGPTESVVIALRHDAALQAQELVFDLIDAGVDVTPPETADNVDRSYLAEVVVAVVASGAYEVIKSVLVRWLDRKGHPASDASVERDQTQRRPIDDTDDAR